jgi:MFS family permease
MTAGKSKLGVFALEGLNSFSTTLFFTYVYFYTQKEFGFGILRNLLLAAVLGAAYSASAYFAGQFAQKAGYLTSVRWGIGLMIILLLVGSQIDAMWPTLAIVVLANMALSLTWPALEAMMSDGEPPVRLQSLVGIYNVVWAVTGGIGYFSGGLMLDKLGPKSIFYVPAGLLVVELIMAFRMAHTGKAQEVVESDLPLLQRIPDGASSPIPPGVFLKMAWIANPLAYLSINTVLSSVPTLAKQFQFSPMQAGFICSIWYFARAGAFVLLRVWSRWHYQFRYLAGAHIALILSFAAMLGVHNIFVLVVSQIIFGVAIGLHYYSSLFYSMDVGEHQGESGGFHEATIGAGNSAGPALAAAALMFFPQFPRSGEAADCIVLLAGLGSLFWLRYRRKE